MQHPSEPTGAGHGGWKQSNYIDWYNHRPTWARVVLLPLLVPIMVVHATAVMVFLVFVLLPYGTFRGSWSSSRFWRELRKRGQTATWSEIADDLIRGTGTLVVEIGLTRPELSWWIDRPHTEVDPERVVPTWLEFEARGHDVLAEQQFEHNPIERWAASKLGGYVSSARALKASHAQLSELPSAIKREAVLVVS